MCFRFIGGDQLPFDIMFTVQPVGQALYVYHFHVGNFN